MGAFGPKRVLFNEDGLATPPYNMVSNEYTLLDLTDLVFIDPVSTGYSRALPGEDVKQFYGVEEDVKWMGSLFDCSQPGLKGGIPQNSLQEKATGAPALRCFHSTFKRL